MIQSMLRVGPLLRNGIAALGLATLAGSPAFAGDRTPGEFLVPAAAADIAPAPGQHQTAIFAGGCFWGIQGVFEHIRGVIRTSAGYDGGARDTAHYEVVSTGATGHAESVKVEYDPSTISYGQLLRIFFSVALDPTQKDMQFPDRGTQYRSVLFTTTPEQRQVATAYIAQLDPAHIFADPIATTVTPDSGFFAAEGYHQNFLAQSPDNPYIARFDLPKVAQLRRLFAQSYQADPVLLLASR
jgi:peptide-methionine (S)-S-oxide reductase